MSPELAEAARIAVAIVFVAAGVLKLRNLDAPAFSLQAVLPLNSASRRLVIAVTAALEISAAVLLLLPATILFATPSFVLLVGFSAYLLVLRRRGATLGCGCLGDFGVAGPTTSLVRNVLLAGLLIVGLTGGGDDFNGWSLIPAVQLALLVVVVPEGVSTLRGLRAIAVPR